MVGQDQLGVAHVVSDGLVMACFRGQLCRWKKRAANSRPNASEADVLEMLRRVVPPRIEVCTTLPASGLGDMNGFNPCLPVGVGVAALRELSVGNNKHAGGLKQLSI